MSSHFSIGFLNSESIFSFNTYIYRVIIIDWYSCAVFFLCVFHGVFQGVRKHITHIMSSHFSIGFLNSETIFSFNIYIIDCYSCVVCVSMFFTVFFTVSRCFQCFSRHAHISHIISSQLVF